MNKDIHRAAECNAALENNLDRHLAERNETMTKHTPGPWLVSINAAVRNDGHTVRCVHFGAEIVTECWQTGTDRGFNKDQQNDERDANAKLIASAPELLTELQQAADVMTEHAKILGNSGGGHFLRTTEKRARIAIAKATE